MTSDETTENAILRVVNTLKLSPKGQTVRIDATDEERVALALQMGVASVETMQAVLLVKRWHKDGVRVSGTLTAKLTQNCVITLAPVENEISAEINAVFVPETSKLAKPLVPGEANELIIDPGGDDLPEAFELPYLDVGAVATEFLALEIDPYPKADGADEKAAETGTNSEKSADDARENPFAELAKLRDKLWNVQFKVEPPPKSVIFSVESDLKQVAHKAP